MSGKNMSQAQLLALLQSLVSGLQKQLPKGQFTLESTAYTTAKLVQMFQSLIAAIAAGANAQAGAKAALVSRDALQATTGPVVLALKRTLQTMYAKSPDTLALFGLKPLKARAPLTSQEKAAAVVKADATRKARGTASKKAKSAISGNVTGITIVPTTTETAPEADAQQVPATSSASTAGK
jgi:hypothetical protein